MQITQLGEFGLIDTIKKYCPSSNKVIKTIGDDAAVLKYSSSKYQLFTTDMLAQDTHFTLKMPAHLIGHKALACNISDIAAMGGLPTIAVVSIGLPKTLNVQWVKDFYKGLGKLANHFDVSIVGGDTIKSNKIIINIALLGEVEKKYLITRDGAKPDDWIFVTGTLGGSFKSGKHLNFMPRIEQARFLASRFKPNAMMDISDGLSSDLPHILKASQVGAVIDFKMIPRIKGVSVEQALNDGEDFELLFTLPSAKAHGLIDWQSKNRSWYFYPIGVITADKKHNLKGKGFRHF